MHHQTVDPLYMRHKLPKVREEYTTVQVRNDLRMTDFIASDPAEVERPADYRIQVLGQDAVCRFALASRVRLGPG